MDRAAERLISVQWEEATGYDSIPTVERYAKSGSGAYLCPWPYCEVRRKDSHAMWRHVHSGHVDRGKRWPPSLPPKDWAPEVSK